MRPVALGLLLMVASPAVTAAQAPSPPCNLETALSQIIMRDANIEAKSAEAGQKVLNELAQLNSKATKPGISLGKQLSVHDGRRFTELSAQLMSMRISSLIESNYARDADVVVAMYKGAWAFFNDPQSKLDEKDIPGSFLFIMRYAFPDVQVTFEGPTSTDCNIENALLITIRDSAQRAANDPAIQQDAEILGQLKQKYGITGDTKFDPSKLQPDDARTLSLINVAMQPTIREYQLAKDSQNILNYWRTAERVYNANKEDLTTYGGDPNSIGKTLDEQMPSFDEGAKTILGIYTKINEKIPSNQATMMKALSESADQILKEYPTPPDK